MLAHMICVNSRTARGALIALLCGFFLNLPLSVRAELGKSAQPQKIPKEFLLPKQEPNGVADRKELLSELYQRLSKSEDEESAVIVADR